jgi:hypothetical protein
MATLAVQPILTNRLNGVDRQDLDAFLTYTNPDNIENYANGWSLENLTSLAEKAYEVVKKLNPILQAGSPQEAVIPGRQWELNHLSEIKEKLANAITMKHSYYENHWFGKITRWFLDFFWLWNNGDTPAIIKAEDFLLRHDTRLPVYKDADGNYQKVFFFFALSADAEWVRTRLDTSRFYNYNPLRPIPLVEYCNYGTLNPRNPQVVIRG